MAYVKKIKKSHSGPTVRKKLDPEAIWKWPKKKLIQHILRNKAKLSWQKMPTPAKRLNTGKPNRGKKD